MAEARFSHRLPPIYFIGLFSVRNDCFRFDLQQHLRRDQCRNGHHRARGTNVAEKFSVSFSNFFPIRNVGKKDACTDNIFQRCSRPLQCVFNVFESLNRLRIGIAGDNFAIGSSRSCARNVNMRPHSNRTRVTDDRLPRCSA